MKLEQKVDFFKKINEFSVYDVKHIRLVHLNIENPLTQKTLRIIIVMYPHTNKPVSTF